MTGKDLKTERPSFPLGKHSEVDVLAVQLPGASSATHHPSKCYPVPPPSATHAAGSWWCRDAQTQAAPDAWLVHGAAPALGSMSLLTVSPSPAYVGWGVSPSPCPPLQHTSAGLSVSSPPVSAPACSSSWAHAPCPIQLFCPVLLTHESSLLITKLQGDSLAHPASILLPSCRVLARDTPSKLQFSHPSLGVCSGVHRTCLGRSNVSTGIYHDKMNGCLQSW